MNTSNSPTDDEIACIVARLDSKIRRLRQMRKTESEKCDLYSCEGYWLSKAGYVLSERELHDDSEDDDARHQLFATELDLNSAIIDRAYWLERAGVLIPDEEREAQDAFKRLGFDEVEAWRTHAIIDLDEALQDTDYQDAEVEHASAAI